jgi:hypothetical protein
MKDREKERKRKKKRGERVFVRGFVSERLHIRERRERAKERVSASASERACGTRTYEAITRIQTSPHYRQTDWLLAAPRTSTSNDCGKTRCSSSLSSFSLLLCL